MPVVTIDGTRIEVDAGTTILAASRELGIDIPVLCFHDGLSVAANCRICLVDVKGYGKLLPACEVQVRDGMEVCTDSEAVLEARKAALEFLMLNHPVDCPICDQAGECELQDSYMEHSGAVSRLNVKKGRKAKALSIGPNVVLDRERCINCTRCVRFCREISGSQQLVQVKRGKRLEVTVFPGGAFDDPYSLCAVDICPVGALTSRDFRFKKRVWRLSSAPSVCPECARGCNILVDHAGGKIFRVRPRYNPEVNGWWACDEGRLAFRRFEENRIKVARIGHHSEPEREATAVEAAEVAGERIAAWLAREKRVALVLSACSSLEEAYSAFRFAQRVLDDRTVYLGARPDGRGDNLLRVEDKNPNRTGIERLARECGITLRPVCEIFEGPSPSRLAAILSIGSEYPLPELPEGLRLEAAIVLAVNWDDVAQHSTIVIPIPSHYEKEGHYVNGQGLLQRTGRIVDPRESAVGIHLLLSKMAVNAGASLGYDEWSDLVEATLAALGDEEAADV